MKKIFVSLFIALFFVFAGCQGENKKKLAFEGGDIFYAREELEDQSITTKNNMKPIKHKGFKFISNFILVVSIITTILSFIAYFL